MPHDVTVLGLGVMGSAAAYFLAKRGLSVLGLEQFTPAHDRGSSHGRTRVIRQAYFEHPDYVPLLFRAYELWRSIEAESGRTLMVQTGGLMIGPENGPIVAGSLESARRYGIPHRMLSRAELSREWPFMRFRPQDVALWENTAGVVFAEDTALAFQERARALGADLRFGVKGEIPDSKCVVTAGSWLPQVLPGFPVQVERQVMLWFDLPKDHPRTPLFIWDYDVPPFYSIPDVRGDGVKVAFHHAGEVTTPERIRRDVGEADIGPMRERLREAIPVLADGFRGSTTCLYTNTPDQHFAIGIPKDRPNLVVASPCSGHGFKFAPVIGEIIADLVVDGKTRLPITPFGLDRLGRTSVQ